MLSLSMLCSFTASADTEQKERIFECGFEDPAEFPGGQKALKAFIDENLVYPEYEKQHGIEGRVVVKFRVDPDGSVQDPVIARGVNEAFDKEALRIVSLFPDWKPGTNHGKPVKSYFNLPINFRLDK